MDNGSGREWVIRLFWRETETGEVRAILTDAATGARREARSLREVVEALEWFRNRATPIEPG